MQTFTTFAIECDIGIAEYVVDELIHRRLFKSAPFAGSTSEGRWAFDLFRQEVADICAGCQQENRE